MKVLNTEYPWFDSLMETIIIDIKETRKKSNSNNNSNFDKMSLLNQSDSYSIGSRFLEELSRAATEDCAFDHWVSKNPALIEFSKDHKFFKSLLTSIGRELRHRATWKKLAFSIVAAEVSMGDVGSDVYTISYYNIIGEEETARLMLVFVILSLALQMILVPAIHHKNKKESISEIVKTLTFTKPAFNKWRVLTNAEMEGHEVVPPITEMASFKLAEVFAESIPVTVLQVNTVLTSEKLDVVVQ